MKAMMVIGLYVLVFCLCQTVTAETLVEKQQSGTPGDVIGNTRLDSKFSLLDPNRFSMSQSYSISYLSYNGNGQTIGLYLNSMRYELSGSVDLNVTLGWLHRPSRLLFANDRAAAADYGRILPNFQLRYEPSEKYRFLISYESIPGVYSNFRANRGWPYINRNSF